VGAALGYKLEKTAQASKTADETAGGGEKVAEKTATGAEAALDERRGG
jgi:hypothetical protein